MSFVDEIDSIKRGQEDKVRLEVEQWYRKKLMETLKKYCIEAENHFVNGWIQVGTPKEYISVSEPYFNSIGRKFRVITPADIREFYEKTACNRVHIDPDKTFYGYGGCSELNFDRALQITEEVIKELGFKEYLIKRDEPIKKGIFKKRIVYSSHEIYIEIMW